MGEPNRPSIRELNTMTLDFTDRTDFDNAERGFVARLSWRAIPV
jgi:alkyl sulfatase BDS1-like metallo-beta-lactamase superfamily hydrolase